MNKARVAEAVRGPIKLLKSTQTVADHTQTDAEFFPRKSALCPRKSACSDFGRSKLGQLKSSYCFVRKLLYRTRWG